MLVPQSGGEAYFLYGVRGGVYGWSQRSDLGVLPTPSGGAVSKMNVQYSAFAPNILFLLQLPSKEEVGFFLSLCIFWVPNLLQLCKHTVIFSPIEFQRCVQVQTLKQSVPGPSLTHFFTVN